MLRSLAPASSNHRADCEWHFHSTAEHVTTFGGDIHNLVHRQKHEIHSDMRVDRSHTGQSHADCHTCHSVFRKRRVHHAIVSETLKKTFRCADKTFVVVHALADDDDA